MDKFRLQRLLRSRLVHYGNYHVRKSNTNDWQEAFRFAERWNRYRGVELDKKQFNDELTKGIWSIETGSFILDEVTWLTLASLSFASDNEKESPNHQFLKELFRMHVSRTFPNAKVKDEVTKVLFGEEVKCDVVSTVDGHSIIGEVGGVQLWKVMAFLHKGNSVMVLPHWTRQKTNPFIRKRLEYQYFLFSAKGGIH